MDEETNCIRLVTELLDCSLLDYCRNQITIPQEVQIALTLQVCKGMHLLMVNGILHRDLAARNVLIKFQGDSTPLAKLCDFGLGKIMEENYYTVSTPGVPIPLKWTSLEALEKKQFSEKSDVWSFGVLMYEIFSLGSDPYFDWSPKEIVPRLRKGERLACPTTCSAAIYKIMCSCWNESPKERPSFEALYEILATLVSEMEEAETQRALMDSTGLYEDSYVV